MKSNSIFFGLQFYVKDLGLGDPGFMSTLWTCLFWMAVCVYCAAVPCFPLFWNVCVTACEAGRVEVKRGPKCRQVGIRSEFI